MRLCVLTALLGVVGCTSGKQTATTAVGGEHEPAQVRTPAPFDADSAYSYIVHQVSAGPRVPGTAGHRATGDWIVAKLREWGYTVVEQPVDGTSYHGAPVRGRNIIATLAPEAEERVLLMAHWDTRAVADQDPTASRREHPIDGADDGGSGTAVLLELARQWRMVELSVGVDFVFFDLEDGGQSGDDDSWCQGSRHWAQSPHREGYRAKYGILLDMVGARGARFYWEYYSYRYGAPILRELWDVARELGYSDYFVAGHGAGIVDDHVPVNIYREIPSVDVVNFDPRGQFGKHWHTHADNLDNIDRATLRAVGETVATLIVSKHRAG